MKHTFRKLLAAGLAACSLSLMGMSGLTASAALVQIGQRGDVNRDGTVNADDAKALAAHLVNSQPLTDEEALTYSDIDKNGTINGADLTWLKRLLITGAEPEGIYEEVPDPEPELISPPIAAVRPTLPCTGTTHILMFAVSFPDCAHSEGYTTDQIWEMSFGPEDTSSKAYPLESIAAYYERASYGRLHMEGDVYQYTAKNSIDSYVESYGSPDALMEEMLSAFDSEIDYTKYDVNTNGVMDTVIVALPGDAAGRDANGDGQEDWWPCSGGYGGRRTYDGVRGGNLCIGAWALSDRSGFNSTWVHELGHAMGLPDYYKYENTQDGYYGLNGDAGLEMMDDAFGDMSAFSKLMYGWYTDQEAQVYTGGTQTFTLQSSQSAPGVIIIPRGDLNDCHSEYFLLEYATPDANNKYTFYNNVSYRTFRNGGIRVMHCNAELNDGWWGPELKWNNYGQYYDSSNQKQRVLRLANEQEGGGFFTSGSTIDSSISGFRWYDSSGYQTVDPGVTVTVGALENGVYTVTISQN